MNNEIKKGDIVRVSKDAPRVYVDEGNDILTKVDSVVEDIGSRLATIVCTVNNTRLWRVIPARHLIKVENMAKEQKLSEPTAPKIKVGDKVRVSKDAPELYTMYGQTDWESVESTVEKIDGDAAEIRWFNENSDEYDYITILCKYLVKVDAEAKEPKFKKGDRVLYMGVLHIVEDVSYANGWKYLIARVSDRIITGAAERFLELYTEPTEQTEAEKKPNVGSIKIPVEVDLTDSYWVQYEADLVKEIVLKIVDGQLEKLPEEISGYALDTAKYVVEQLKRNRYENTEN